MTELIVSVMAILFVFFAALTLVFSYPKSNAFPDMCNSNSINKVILTTLLIWLILYPVLQA